jgi:hypothetical protein
MLALMFTAVKMLYVCGGLQVLPTLINLLEPLRVDRDPHLKAVQEQVARKHFRRYVHPITPSGVGRHAAHRPGV